MNSHPKENTRAVDIIYVALQFLIFFLYIVFPNVVNFDFPKSVFWIGIGISAFGFVFFLIGVFTLGKSLSLYPSPSPKSKLMTRGVFRYIRHPVYTGLLLFLFGISLAFAGLAKFVLFVAAVILFSQKADYEESRLILKYPEYEDYKTQTGKFFPKF